MLKHRIKKYRTNDGRGIITNSIQPITNEGNIRAKNRNTGIAMSCIFP